MSRSGATPDPEDPIDPQGFVAIDTTAQVLGISPGRVIELFRVRDLVPNDPAFVTYRCLIEAYERDVAGAGSAASDDSDDADDEMEVAVC